MPGLIKNYTVFIMGGKNENIKLHIMNQLIRLDKEKQFFFNSFNQIQERISFKNHVQKIRQPDGLFYLTESSTEENHYLEVSKQIQSLANLIPIQGFPIAVFLGIIESEDLEIPEERRIKELFYEAAGNQPINSVLFMAKRIDITRNDYFPMLLEKFSIHFYANFNVINT